MENLRLDYETYAGYVVLVGDDQGKKSSPLENRLNQMLDREIKFTWAPTGLNQSSFYIEGLDYIKYRTVAELYDERDPKNCYWIVKIDDEFQHPYIAVPFDKITLY